jgi:hypothetical protein
MLTSRPVEKGEQFMTREHHPPDLTAQVDENGYYKCLSLYMQIKLAAKHSKRRVELRNGRF